MVTFAVMFPVTGARKFAVRRLTSAATSRPCPAATSTLSPVTPVFGFWSAPQPMATSATEPGNVSSIAAAANPAQSPPSLLCESVTQWQA